MSSPDQQEHNLTLMAEGREAVAITGVVAPYVQERIADLVNKMVSAYRANAATHDFLLGTAAQIAGMYDMLSDLKTTATRGDIAANKEMNNDRPTTR